MLFTGVVSAEKMKPIWKKGSVQSSAFIRVGDSISNIVIRNTSASQTFAITGIFIQQLFQADCSTSYFDNHGKLYGVIWSDSITFNPSTTTPLGAEYLYSMVMNYLYEAATSPGGPVATTPGSGGATRTWCIQLGILQGAPAQYTTYSVTTETNPNPNLSNVVTWTNNTSPAPIAISCDDGEQQCIASATFQDFPVS